MSNDLFAPLQLIAPPDMLNAMNKRFAMEYSLDFNGTQAAIRAGYSPASAAAQATRLLKNENIINYIKEHQREQFNVLGITKERILLEYASMAFANMGDYYTLDIHGNPLLDWSMLTRMQTAAISEITVETFSVPKRDGARGEQEEVRRVKFKLANKKDALAEITKLLGLDPASKLEITGKDGGPVQAIAVTMDAKTAAELYAQTRDNT